MGYSPTQRSLKLLRDRGFLPWVAEYYHAFSRRRVDLYGIIDIVAIKKEERGVLGVQTTVASAVSARIKKISASPAARIWVMAGNRIVIHGWRKPTKTRKKWTLREVEWLWYRENWAKEELTSPENG